MTDPDTGKTEEKTEAQKREELDAYQKLRARLQKALDEARGMLGTEAVTGAVDRAARELRELGEHSKETVARVTETLKKDLASTAEALRPRVEALAGDAERLRGELRSRGGAFWQEATEGTSAFLEVSRDKGGELLVKVSRAVAEWSRLFGDKLDGMLVYHTGEVTHGGEFRCTGCGATVGLKKPGHLPPCPKCHGTEFRRA